MSRPHHRGPARLPGGAARRGARESAERPSADVRRAEDAPDRSRRTSRVRGEPGFRGDGAHGPDPVVPGPPCVVTVAEALVQVAMHTQHHRGQCMTRLKDLGGEPKNVDWIIWLWKEKPRGRWD